MGPPSTVGAAVPAISTGGGFLLRDGKVAIAVGDVSALRVRFLAVSFGLGGHPLLILGKRGSGDEEVDGAPLELGLGREYEDAANHALRARLAQDVVRVCLEDFPGRDGARYFLDVAVQVDDPDQVESPAGKNAGQATPQAVPHNSLSLNERADRRWVIGVGSSSSFESSPTMRC